MIGSEITGAECKPIRRLRQPMKFAQLGSMRQDTGRRPLENDRRASKSASVTFLAAPLVQKVSVTQRTIRRLLLTVPSLFMASVFPHAAKAQTVVSFPGCARLSAQQA